MSKSTLGGRLKELRVKKKISQERLGELVGVSRSTISMYEINRREPDTDTLKRLAEFFGVSTDYLLGRSRYFPEGQDPLPGGVREPGDPLVWPGEPEPDPVLGDIQRRIKKLTPAGRLKLLQVLTWIEEIDEKRR